MGGGGGGGEESCSFCPQMYLPLAPKLVSYPRTQIYWSW